MEFDNVVETVTYYVTTYSFRLVAAILVFLIGKWIVGRLTHVFVKLLEKNKVEPTLIHFLENVVYYVLMVLVLVAVASQLGINTTSFLTIIGAAGLGVALALKDSLSNIASGVMLIFLRPFTVGDVVTIAGVTGKVESLNIFHTTINTLDNMRVTIPNSNITTDSITNLFINPTRRVDLVFGIGYGDDIPKAKQILNDLTQADTRILKDPAHTVAVFELGDSSVNFVVRPWVNADDYWPVYFDLTEKVKRTFDDEGISIPFPQRDVHLYQETAE
jgi:small conductance mechanosensitive channel